jgi:Holliday junction resolvase RusA-like endonuclease
MSLQWYSGKNVGNPKKKMKIVKAEKTKYCAMKLSQIRRRIELIMRDIILCFEVNLEIFLDSFIHIRIFKQIPKCYKDPQGHTVHQQRPQPRG